MYQRILVPTAGDGEGGATFGHGLGVEDDGPEQRSFERALSMAQRDNAEVHVLVLGSNTPGLGASRSSGGGIMVDNRGGTRGAASSMIRRLTEHANERGVRTVAQDCEGDPTYEIFQYVHQNDIDAVVLDSEAAGIDELTCRTLRHGGVDVVTV